MPSGAPQRAKSVHIPLSSWPDAQVSRVKFVRAIAEWLKRQCELTLH